MDSVIMFLLLYQVNAGHFGASESKLHAFYSLIVTSVLSMFFKRGIAPPYCNSVPLYKV